MTENLRVLEAAASMRPADSAGLGRLLTASHRSLALDYEVSTPELDVAVDAALDAGAFGARLTGGDGGCVIAIAPTRHFHDIEDAVRRAFSDRFGNLASSVGLQALALFRVRWEFLAAGWCPVRDTVGVMPEAPTKWMVSLIPPITNSPGCPQRIPRGQRPGLQRLLR